MAVRSEDSSLHQRECSLENLTVGWLEDSWVHSLATKSEDSMVGWSESWSAAMKED
jgi:hypothetical protein